MKVLHRLVISNGGFLVLSFFMSDELHIDIVALLDANRDSPVDVK